MIIDFHTHAFPPAIAAQVVKTLQEGARRVSGSPMNAHTDATADGLRRSMKEHGVDLSVVMPIATKPTQTETINRYAWEISHDGLVSFGSLHPDNDDTEGILEKLAEAGFRGIKLHPEFQNFYIDSPESLRILKRAERLGLIVLLHTGADIGIPPPVHCAPERLRGVLDHVSGHNIVAAHMGGFDLWEDAERYLVGTPVYLDTAVVAEFLDANTAKHMIEAHGTDRVLMASDSPWTNQGRSIAYIREMGLSTEDTDKILGGNARRLLGL